MTFASASASSTSARSQISGAARQLGELLVSAVQDGQDIALNAARNFGKATSTIVDGWSDVRGADALTDVRGITASSFDVAIEVLKAQKDVADKLVSAWVPRNGA